MRIGVLIVGSLLWDNGARESWRRSRLRVNDRVCVTTPMCYGRKSRNRGDTFTMTLCREQPVGQAALVPCAAQIADLAGLVAEAEALWKAEQPTAERGRIGADWGSVGVLFRDERAHADLATAWRRHFRSTASAIKPVDEDGRLCIPWPAACESGRGLTLVDVILATATKAAKRQPTPVEVADAWLQQAGGHERYFFENVRHGIRTADDALIWRRFEQKKPAWLSRQSYADSVGMLREESARDRE